MTDQIQFIPEMISWYHDGKFPIDTVVKFFKVRTTRFRNSVRAKI
jgi:Zn-dependent alcohol dehydrogenase